MMRTWASAIYVRSFRLLQSSEWVACKAREKCTASAQLRACGKTGNRHMQLQEVFNEARPNHVQRRADGAHPNIIAGQPYVMSRYS